MRSGYFGPNSRRSAWMVSISSIGVEHAALQLDLAEAVLAIICLHWRTIDFGSKHLAVFVFARVIAQAAAAGVLIEQVGRERNLVARPSAEQVAKRLANALPIASRQAISIAAKVRACWSSGFSPGTRYVCVRPPSSWSRPPPKELVQSGQLKRVAADDEIADSSAASGPSPP